MSEQLSDPIPTERAEVPGKSPEASPRKEADGGEAQRSSLERSDRLLSGAQPPSATPAPHEASPRPPFAGQPPQASPAELSEHTNPLPPLAESLNGDPLPALAGRRRGGRVLMKPVAKPEVLSPEQRLLLLDTWKRSGLPAADFAAMVGLSKHTLYTWKHKFEEEGPSGLVDRPRGGPKGSKVHDLTKRTILMLKEANPDWGCQRISDMLVRGPALPASPSAVARVLREAGYEVAEEPTQPHPDKVRSFERARPNQLWQTDLFTFGTILQASDSILLT